MHQKPLYLGAAYYPEMWDRETIDWDIQKMKQCGVNCVRIGEFAWSTMEPSEGEYDFSLFEYVLDRMEQAGIGVVVCTPTATPPKWLTDKYPETLRTLDSGAKRQFGARGHSCRSSRIYREKTAQIVNRMCAALAQKKAVIGWQIDNEIYPYDNGCFCEQCVAGFRRFLERKYQTVQTLNRQWGTARWSLTYRDFEDVIPPREDTWNHPALQADWLTFQSENIIDYVQFQKEIISRYTDAPVGTDMMTCAEVDHCRMNENLDVIQINHYEKQEDLWRSGFWFDYMRTIKERPFWCVETQANWFGATAAHGGARAAGNVYANTLLPFFKGGQMNLFWLWRTHPNGQEMMHGALYNCAGRPYCTTPYIRRASEDLQKAQQWLVNSKIQSEVAIQFSTPSAIQLKYASATDGFEYTPAMLNIYKAFLRHNVDIIGAEQPVNGYKVLISPYLSYISPKMKESILEWVYKGGRWIVGPMSDIYDYSLRRYTHSPFGFLEEVTGTGCAYSIPVDQPDYRAAWRDGRTVRGSGYYDGYQDEDRYHLAVYTDGDLAGLGMITEKPYGKGQIVLVGSVVDPEVYVSLTGTAPCVLASENVMANLLTTPQGEKVLVCMELMNKPATVILNGTYRNVLTGRILTGENTLGAYEAAVLVEV